MKLCQKMLPLLLGLMTALFPLQALAADTPPLPPAEELKPAQTYTVSYSDGTAVVTAADGASATFEDVLAVHQPDGMYEVWTLDILTSGSAYTSSAKSLSIGPENTDVFNIADARYALYEYDFDSHTLGKATGEVIDRDTLLKQGLQFGDSQIRPGIGWRILPDAAGVLQDLPGYYAAAVSNSQVLSCSDPTINGGFCIRIASSPDDTLIADIAEVIDTSGGQWLRYTNGKWGFRLSEDMEGTLISWKKIGGKWYYFNYVDQNKNEAVTGWKRLSGREGGWYWFDQNCAMQIGWQQIDGDWYFFSGGGRMQTGWLLNGGDWYYLTGSGAMKTGWQKSGGKWYYLGEDGRMLKSCTVDGYTLDETGAWIS